MRGCFQAAAYGTIFFLSSFCSRCIAGSWQTGLPGCRCVAGSWQTGLPGCRCVAGSWQTGLPGCRCVAGRCQTGLLGCRCVAGRWRTGLLGCRCVADDFSNFGFIILLNEFLFIRNNVEFSRNHLPRNRIGFENNL